MLPPAKWSGFAQTKNRSLRMMAFAFRQNTFSSYRGDYF
jgi:hypothetical protein